MPSEFFKQMRMAKCRETGEYFVGLGKFMKENLKMDALKESEFQEQIKPAFLRPWMPPFSRPGRVAQPKREAVGHNRSG